MSPVMWSIIESFIFAATEVVHVSFADMQKHNLTNKGVRKNTQTLRIKSRLTWGFCGFNLSIYYRFENDIIGNNIEMSDVL